MPDRPNFQEGISRIEGLIRQLEATADPASRSLATELVRSLMDLHGTGLERMLEIVAGSAGERGEAVIDRFGLDPLVSSLLVLYGIHPEDLESRVRRGLEQARVLPQLRGATVELLAVTQDVVRLRVQREATGCGSTSSAIRMALEEAILECAPDANNVIVEGLEQQVASSGFVPLEALLTPARKDQELVAEPT